MRVGLISLAVLLALAGLVLAQEEVVFKNYNLKHLQLKNPEVRRKIETELRKVVSPTGQFILDERSNTIIVRDNETNHNEVAKVLAKLDVGEKKESSTITITVRVANVLASTARKTLEEAMTKDEALKGLKISHSDETCAVILTGTAPQLENAKTIIDALEEKFRSAVETKVYKIKNRSAASLADIVKLHLAGAPGTGVAMDEVTNSLIVRETLPNQEKVKQVVREFDTELATLLLQFRVIYASREAKGVDESIKDVAQELEKMFDFTSYRALEGPVLKVEQGHNALVQDSGSGMTVEVKRCDYDAESGKIRIEGLKVSKKMEKGREEPSMLTISTTIRVKLDHTLVLGGASSKNARDALIVVLKATLAK